MTITFFFSFEQQVYCTNNLLIYFMLDILKKKLNFKNKSLNIHYRIEEQHNTQTITDNEFKNIIYYPSSSKEWFNSIYSYNKSYVKSLVTKHVILNNLFKSYFNMFENKIKILYKRRRASKSRYSSNRVYVSRAELKHTNSKIIIILYIYNKQKSFIERNIRKLIKFTAYEKHLIKDKTKIVQIHRNRLEYFFKRFFYFKK